ncbi:MAG TPA: hypothetical protein VJ694_00170, partial [Patescibacteria group bacterium]|nr:hypothetical protein [Patescibacteria group bacterium]
IIVMFFQLFVGAATIGTVAGIHALGTAAGEELSRYDAPAPKRTAAPKPAPIERAEGIPVAYQASKARP